MNIIGRLTRDAQVHTLKDDRQVVNFSVAVNDRYRNKGGEQVERTAYFDCSYWLTPKIAPYLTKGTLVELTGRASARAWTGKDGEPHAGMNFHTSHISLHGGGGKPETVQPTANDGNRKLTVQPIGDDLPF